MGNTVFDLNMLMMMRVGAVGNACCAFSKAFVGAVLASTMPAASTRRSSSLTASGRLNPSRSLIEATQPDGTEMQVPLPIIDRFEADRFADQHRADDDIARVPRHDAR